MCVSAVGNFCVSFRSQNVTRQYPKEYDPFIGNANCQITTVLIVLDVEDSKVNFSRQVIVARMHANVNQYLCYRLAIRNQYEKNRIESNEREILFLFLVRHYATSNIFLSIVKKKNAISFRQKFGIKWNCDTLRNFHGVVRQRIDINKIRIYVNRTAIRKNAVRWCMQKDNTISILKSNKTQTILIHLSFAIEQAYFFFSSCFANMCVKFSIHCDEISHWYA